MEKKLQQKLIRLIAWTLSGIFLVSILFFYATVQSILLENMERSNQSLVDQINASFETVMEQVTDQVYKLSLYENDLLEAVEERKVIRTAATDLYKVLDSIVMSNRYFFSAYLYSPTDDCFFTSEWGSAHSKDSFYDQAVLPAVESGLVTKVEPRLIYAPGKVQKLLFSVVIPIPLSANMGRPQCILTVNVDAGKLYADILKKNNATEHTRFYVVDEDARILISEDSELISRPLYEVETRAKPLNPLTLPVHILMGHPLAVESVSVSPQLEWSFYLKDAVQFDSKYVRTSFLVGLMVSLLFGIAVVVSYLFIRRSTRSLHMVIYAYNAKLLRDILLGSTNQQEMIAQLSEMNQGFSFSRFAVAFVEVAGSHNELSALVGNVKELIPALPQWGDVRIADIKPGTMAVVFNFNDAKPKETVQHWQETVLHQLCAPLEQHFHASLFITISGIKEGMESLSASTQECIRMQQYKLTMTSGLLRVEQFQVNNAEVEYPVQQEKQLINNLMVSNSDGCVHYLEKFLDQVFSVGNPTDMQILNQIYQLQNNILKTVSSLPISIRLNQEGDLLDCYDRRQIQEELQQFIQTILEEINKKDALNDHVLLQSIFSYIEDNLTEHEFNLNSLSYQFNLNRNYLARLIREQTGQSFNDYVNHKKMAMAKELLQDRSLTVESIARQCGFAYTHYFIKIFKGLEGITPGQYREMQEGNKNAPQEPV